MTNLKIAVGIALAWLCLQDPPKDPDLLLHLPFDGGTADDPVGTPACKVEWGEGRNTAEWEANKATRDYAKTPWRVGVANPTAKKWAWPAKGLIDEVRIYKKALSDAEVAALYKDAK